MQFCFLTFMRKEEHCSLATVQPWLWAAYECLLTRSSRAPQKAFHCTCHCRFTRTRTSGEKATHPSIGLAFYISHYVCVAKTVQRQNYLKKKKKSEPKIHYKWKRTFLEYLFVFILTAVLFVICDWIWTVCGCLGIKCMKSSWGALNASSYCLVEMSHPPQNSGTLVATTQDSLGSAKWYRKFGVFFLFLSFVCFLAMLHSCGILVPWPGIAPGPSEVRAWSSNHWTKKEFPKES